jgi:hypothetical protein
MFRSDAPIICFECLRAIRTLEDDGGFCIICSRPFCRAHMRIRSGVANCAGCEVGRRLLEEAGAVPAADAARVRRLLGRDAGSTIGGGHEAVIEEAVARIRLFAHDSDDFEQRVVDDVQQWLHDSFVDTSWPVCPEHGRHPLWYSGGWWRCDQAGNDVARLGELAAAFRRRDHVE